MKSPGVVGGLSRAESGQLMTGSSVWPNLEKSTISHVKVSPKEKPVGLLQRQEGAHMHAVETAGEQSPAGNSGSQIGCAEERCCHTPTVVSPSEMLHAEGAMQFSLTHQHGCSLLTCCPHSHQSGGASGTWPLSRHQLLRLCQMRTIFMPWLSTF